MRRAVLSFLVCLGSVLAAENDTLGSLARRFVTTASPAAREALLRFAAEHSTQPDGALARLALGIGDYQEKKFTSAAEQLLLASEKPTELDDYAVYYRARTLASIGNHAGAAQLVDDFGKRFPSSPLAASARSLRAESLSLSGRAREGLELLAAAPASTAPALLLLAQAAERAEQTVRAAQLYQRVYHEFPTSAEQATALAALKALRAGLGSRYPAASPAMRLGRADKLAAAGKHSAARAEYRTLAAALKGLPHEQAAVRVGVCDYNLKANTRAYRWLKTLKVTQPEADAERLHYLGACARRLKREEEFTALVTQLGRLHPASSWYEEALLAAGNNFLVENTSEKYIPYYRAIYESFPAGRYAATAHWKVAWQAYLEKKPEARQLLEEQIKLYPSSPQLTAAVYWVGRLAEAGGEWSAARACYDYLLTKCPNYYYTLLAADRGKSLPAGGNSPAPASLARLLAEIPPAAPPPSHEPPPEWSAARRRARLLSQLGFGELADRELRFRAESPRLAYHAALELAQQAADRGNIQQAVRYLKHYAAGYLAFPLEALPRRFWELLFPFPWRDEIESYSKLHDLDPYLVAALIRQESEFNPGALSRARARGLMQIMPSTGRRLGRNLGIGAVPANRLYIPDTSLKLGTLHLRRVLDQYNGRLEPALAGYNAGEHRADRWLVWHPATDPAEFVENIPFTETRTYVQSVLRNAEIYRKLYGKG